MNRASSQVPEGTSGFLSISDINLGVSVQSEQGRQALSCKDIKAKVPKLFCVRAARFSKT